MHVCREMAPVYMSKTQSCSSSMISNTQSEVNDVLVGNRHPVEPNSYLSSPSTHSAAAILTTTSHIYIDIGMFLAKWPYSPLLDMKLIWTGYCKLFFFCFINSEMSPIESSQCSEKDIEQMATGTELENDYDVLPLFKRWCIHPFHSLFARHIYSSHIMHICVFNFALVIWD